MTKETRPVTWLVLLSLSKSDETHIFPAYITAKNSEDAIALALVNDLPLKLIRDGYTLTAKQAEVVPENICPSNSEFDTLRIRCPSTGKLKSLFLDLEGIPTEMKSDLEKVLQKHARTDFSLDD